MKCEYCKEDHDGNYGSGRFCSITCSKKYASNINSKQKGIKISKAMKNRWKNGGHIQDKEKLKLMVKIAAKSKKLKRQNLLKTGKWEELPLTLKKERVLQEQNNKCLICGIEHWNKKPLVLHFDHIDGNSKNNDRNNVRFICPNCHSQTETYCGNKQKLPQFEYLKTTKENLKLRSSIG